MTFEEFKAQVLGHHAEHSNRHGLARVALADMEAALGSLAMLGHQIQVSWSTPDAPLQFPKMLYHGDLGERTVHSSEEENQARSEGWATSPTASSPAMAAPASEPIPDPVPPPSGDSQNS